MKTTLITITLVMFTIFCNGQNNISGTVSEDYGEPLIGATIQVEGSLAGTITDFDGKFTLSTKKAFPITLLVTYTGFGDKRVTLEEAKQDLVIVLESQATTLGEITVTSASKFDERSVEAPVTIEKVDIVELRSTASIDAYGTIGNLKGVQSNTGSLTFTSVNTRGFADMQNWRFVQLLDGMFANAPGLGYPLGGNSGPADIDILSMELIPGANSALYGANAFNGLLTIKTKDPFYYQGLSAYVKGGATIQEAGGTNPLTDVGFRYAKSYNDKFAFKINFGYMSATDWTADDDTYYINSSRSADPTPYLSLDRNNPADAVNFDAVNIYGDEVQAQVDLGGGSTVPVNRTGIKESDIIDYDVQVIKGDIGLHYRITEKVEASYSYRFIQSDAILRHTTIYPLVNLGQTFHNFQLKGSNWDFRAYHSQEDTQDSYAMLATGGFIEQGRKSNDAWGTDYGSAFSGEVANISAGDHAAARIYADRDMPAVDSPAFKNLREATLSNSDLTTGGSRFIDNTRLLSVEGNYDLTPHFNNKLSMQVGGNFRRFTLDSEGQLFNDGPLGFGEVIPVDEHGAYMQLGKKVANERIHLRGSIRYDKHQDYDAAFTPRLSVVAALDKEKNHNIRASFQTGFRNPAPQEGYINLDIGAAILLGGSENNINNLTYQRPDNGAIIQGKDLHSGLITLGSFLAFRASGDPADFVPANLSLLEQEKNSTFEIGYKGVIGKKLLVDLNYYNTRYSDLLVRLTTFSPDAGRVYAVYTNIDDDVTSKGVGLGLDYLIGKGYKAGFNYTYTAFDAEDAIANNPGFLPSFNTPENRINVSLSNANINNSNFGFNVKFKHWDDYTWQSPFGAGKIDAASVVDLALTYKITDLQSMIKVGATNLFNQEYRTVYGGPNVGSIIFVGWTYDQMFSR